MNKGLTGLNLREWTRETKVKNQRTPYTYLFLENTDYLASLIHNEPVMYAIAAAGLAPLEQRPCPPYFENLDKCHLAVFVQVPWLCPKQLPLLNMK